MVQTLKLIRKKDEITALNGTVVDGLGSGSTTDAPSIRVVDGINNRVTVLETNGVAVEDSLTSGSTTNAPSVNAVSTAINTIINTEIENLKKSVSDGKTLVANAITAKGVTTATDASFSTMATNISNIKNELTGDAVAGNVLSGKTFYNTDPKTKVTGTMTNRGAVTATVNVGASYTIPAGYHNGSGKVTGATLSGNATAADVVSGKTFYSNSGTKQTGTLALNFPSGYKLMTGSKDWGSIDLAANGIIPIYLYWSCSGTQWTSFPSDVYVKDNNGKTYGSCHVNENSSGSGSGYTSVWELYSSNWDSMKTIKTLSITGSQAPSGSVSIKVWLEKVG